MPKCNFPSKFCGIPENIFQFELLVRRKSVTQSDVIKLLRALGKALVINKWI